MNQSLIKINNALIKKMKRKILLLALATFPLVTPVKASENEQNKASSSKVLTSINLNLKKVSLEKVFKIIESQAQKKFKDFF